MSLIMRFSESNREQIVKRFISYTEYNTTGIENNHVLPSCEGQIKLAKYVLDELETLGCVDISLNEYGIGSAVLPSNDSSMKDIALFSHLDTAPDHNTDTFAKIVKNYQGGDIPFINSEGGLTLDENPELIDYIGDDIIMTDGTSLLGADDKAAIASIVECVKFLVENDDIRHGKITVVLLPDEETGIRGAHALDVSNIKADFGLCLDCCGIGEYVIQNFFAANAVIDFKGVTAHPMSAKGKLKNATIMANELISSLPSSERPEHTEGREGYWWVKGLTGNTQAATLKIDIRDFDENNFIKRKDKLIEEVTKINKRYGYQCAKITIKDDYSNVNVGLEANPFILNTIEKAMEKLNINKKPLIMRGGYDGSVITPKGLTTGNIFTGAHNFHSVTEYLPVSSLIASCKMLIQIISSSK